MRFLHTGDWHLGKVFHEVSLIEDQREFLRQVCEEYRVDVVETTGSLKPDGWKENGK